MHTLYTNLLDMRKIRLSYILVSFVISIFVLFNTTYAVDVSEPETLCSIWFSPELISQGEWTALRRRTSNALEASIDNGIGNVSVPSGWERINLTGSSRDFTITVIWKDGKTVECSASITIGESEEAPQCEIGVDPVTIKKGEWFALRWRTSGAATWLIDNGIGDVVVPSDWRRIVPEKTTIYTLSLVGNNWITSECSTKIVVEDNTPVGKSPVMFVIDDPQYWWLEDISVDVTQININKNVDITLDVVPENMSLSTILWPKLKDWFKNKKWLVQIAQHGFTHSGDEYNMNLLSYEKQKEIISNGLNEFAKLGIIPTSFTPPGWAQNQTTIKILGEFNFKTILDWWTGSTSTDDILVVKQSWVELCNGYDQIGADCKFKSPTVLINEMDAEIAKTGYTVVVFHIQDFVNTSGTKDLNKISQYETILNQLKTSWKYDFMTVEEYHDNIGK